MTIDTLYTPYLPQAQDLRRFLDGVHDREAPGDGSADAQQDWDPLGCRKGSHRDPGHHGHSIYSPRAQELHCFPGGVHGREDPGDGSADANKD